MSEQDPNILNLMVSQYDCAKQNNLRQTFCRKPEPLYSTQYEDIFVTYLDGFDMNKGQPRPHSIIDQKIIEKYNSILLIKSIYSPH